MRDYNGKCPICQATLQTDEAFLYCGTHYKTGIKEYEIVWRRYALNSHALALYRALMVINDAEPVVDPKNRSVAHEHKATQ